MAGSTVIVPKITGYAAFDPTAIALTGGTIGGSNIANGVVTPLGKWGIPFIHLSSGSVSAAGAISAITALPRAYPSAFCWFPANALATAIAAGWYYCTFSTTTAGTAFLNTYTSGAPAVPASPTAVTDGKGAYTSDTAEHVAVSLPIAAGALGANGMLDLMHSWEYTNSVGTKNLKVYLGGTGGTNYFFENGVTTQLYTSAHHVITNNGTVSGQIGHQISCVRSSGIILNAPVTGSINTANATTVDFSMLKSTAADNVVLDWGAVLQIANGA